MELEGIDLVLVGIADVLPLIASGAAFIYGVCCFFKKGKPLFLQALTLAMGSYALGSAYHLCQILTSGEVLEGFTPAYLSRIGFFLFFLTASVGYMDGIVDDRTPAMRKSKLVAIAAPVAAALLYIPNAIVDDVPISTKIAYFLVWLPALTSLYFNLKHAALPNLDFGFVEAIRPYNILALALGFSELLCMTAWFYFYPLPLAISAVVFSALCIATVVSAKKGAAKWTI